MKLSEDQRVLFASTSMEMKGWSHDECAAFFESCERAGLDPFSRQIYPMLRVDYQSGDRRVSAGVTIDGFRIIASRSGKYRGQSGPFWCGKDGQWADVWLDDANPPAAAKVGVLHTDFAEPLWAVARFNDYKQTKKGGDLNMIWSKMGPTMVAKCAEALALRRAFPDHLSGFYTADEMGQADNPAPDRPAFDPNQTKVAKKSPMELVKAAADKAGVVIEPASKIEAQVERYGPDRGAAVEKAIAQRDIEVHEIRTLLIEQGTNPEEVSSESIADWPYKVSGKVKQAVKDIQTARKQAEQDAQAEDGVDIAVES